MKAIVRSRYGTPEVLELGQVDPPEIGDGDVLVRVRAAAVNPYDWHMMTGKPYLVRLQAGLRSPKRAILGGDGAGVVEAVGDAVDEFQPGDEVFGSLAGAYAEYARSQPRYLVSKPDGVSFEEAAASPTPGVTALQGLRDRGRIAAGKRVLINGASGGVGTFAVQVAKSFGAEVTGVCSTRNVDMVASLGADHVIDYTKDDFTSSDSRYDLIFDVVANHSLRRLRRVLEPDGAYVRAGSEEKGDWIQPITGVLKLLVASRMGEPDMATFLARISKDDLLILQGLLASGDVEPVIERTYSLDEAAEALLDQGKGHARGKKIITV